MGPDRAPRVLYVDDEKALVRVVTGMLRSLGYEAAGHTDPGQALGDFRSRPHHFDVVLVDALMPGMSGVDLARELHAIRADVRVVLSSGYLPHEEAEAAGRAGVCGTILKPYSCDDLRRMVERVLAVGRVAASPHA